jgi:DNA topoisomerase-1
MLIKWGRYGKFLACSGYPSCKNSVKLKEDQQKPSQLSVPELAGEKCEQCGNEMVIREGRFGRYLACRGYPTCKNTKSLKLNIRCPREGCEGHLVEKRSRRGRVFYGCSEYPKCNYTAWQIQQAGDSGSGSQTVSPVKGKDSH